MKTEAEIRKALVHYSRESVARGLSNATAGNLSVRFGDGMLITPSGITPDRMEEDQIAEVAFDGTFKGNWKPSSEWALHAILYRNRPEAQGIVHAHPTYCVALSTLREPMPSFHYMVASFGGNEVPCAPYRTFGGPELAQAVAETMGTKYRACLMANHGMIALAGSLGGAFDLTEKLEVLARQYQLARTMGAVKMLTDEEMAEVHEAYKSYGYGKPGAVKG
ncbi:fuculose phosphate aldolase [Oceanicola sp. 22II-s10i]|uniref:class II aldolase/adducin family protein n=1 Tax=Oceanicola sp. 22II-s10i TaxID=1317116 RepID=UPI000B520B46|nr:class II aldolase/adducin family protein [Oceanicola sp. 22II-s10i]OWU83068.1 fuculose phosphate aldolase [Oceanicola sp. 22II-s10i]